MDVTHINAITDIAAECWDSLQSPDYPFSQHAFLTALEQSGTVSAATGWQPQHLLVYDDHNLIAVLPMYLKSHSQGEYVFDHQWAHSYQHYGLDYYPKLLTAIPFTPCQGPRLLCRDNTDSASVLAVIFEYIKDRLASVHASSWHYLFPIQEQMMHCQAQGLNIREGVQYQWFNRGYRDFSDYLERFKSVKRKQIKRERRRIIEQGIEFKQLTGHAIDDQHWQVFFRFYATTYLKHGMQSYLNLDFFQRLGANMPDSLLLVVAEKDRQAVGAALSLHDSNTLYGRYWGCFEEFQNLHFETCYYQGLDYCLHHGLQRFDSGAQGEHKIARGFEPVSTWSAHWLQHPEFNRAIADFLMRERAAIADYKRHAHSQLPFKAAT